MTWRQDGSGILLDAALLLGGLRLGVELAGLEVRVRLLTGRADQDVLLHRVAELVGGGVGRGEILRLLAFLPGGREVWE